MSYCSSIKSDIRRRILVSEIKLTEEVAPAGLKGEELKNGPPRGVGKVDYSGVEKVTHVEQCLLFLDELANSFNCVTCKSVANKSVVSFMLQLYI